MSRPSRRGWTRMRCLDCGSQAVTERPERTAQGDRRFRCRACGKPFNERSGGVLNRAQYPSDVIALVVLWRLRYTQERFDHLLAAVRRRDETGAIGMMEDPG